MTIAEVLPLCPIRINGNVGRKYKSQATQLGQNLSHIDAYNGEKKGTCGSVTHVLGMRPCINKLLLKKPPGLMSADSMSVVCKQGTNGPLKAVREKKVRRREI